MAIVSMATVSTRTSLRMPTAMLSMAMLTLAMNMDLPGIPMPMASFGVGGEFGQVVVVRW